MSGPAPKDPVALAQALIRKPSVTPKDEGALAVLEEALRLLGFHCHRLRFEEEGAAPIDNLYARLGDGAPHFCFAGHTDVVPVGAEDAWSKAPFDGAVDDGKLWGRGAADMKGAIAAFVAACGRFLTSNAPFTGSISFLITGDEEGPAINGTRKMLRWLADRGEIFDHCLVGEPTNPQDLGEMIKIGRRGSMNAWLTVTGRQGHVAYPHLADNPITKLNALMSCLIGEGLDEGYDFFQPSNLEITDLEVGNPTENVIPEKATARFNVRFNPNWTGESLEAHLRARLDDAATKANADYTLNCRVSGEAFLTPKGAFTDLLQDAVKSATGRMPELSTTGGTSDARFIKDYAPVVEFGLISKTMHQTDEHVAVADVTALTEIYLGVLQRYFANP